MFARQVAIASGAALGLIAVAAAVAYTITPRYELVALGAGTSARIDRLTGETVGCSGWACGKLLPGGGWTGPTGRAVASLDAQKPIVPAPAE